VQGISFTCIQHSRYSSKFVKSANSSRHYAASCNNARHSKCSQASLLLTSTKQKPAGLDFTIHNEFTISIAEIPTQLALTGTFFSSNQDLSHVPLEVNIFALPHVCTVIRHLHFYRTLSWITADLWRLD